MTLEFIWYGLIVVLIAGYGILGGYDLGVGSLYLFYEKRADRSRMLQAIGPFWDANQVWLITAGGAIFAAFPFVFATVFSGFYLALILLLFAIMIRVTSIEFGDQLSDANWRKIWDTCFGVGSLLMPVLLGVALGNIMRGIPLDEQTNYAGGFFDLLNPYAVGVGALSLSLFIMQGIAFLRAVEPSMAENLKNVGKNTAFATIALFTAITVSTYFYCPHLLVNMKAMPVLLIVPTLALILMVAYLIFLPGKSWLKPLLASSLSILCLVVTMGISLFPRLVPNINSVGKFTAYSIGVEQPHLQESLTALNSSSSQLTLTVMLIVAGIGVPVMLAYTAYVYRQLFKKA